MLGNVAIDDSFGVASLVNVDGQGINWGSINDGIYTLIGTASTFNNIQNFGLANAATLVDGRMAYFQNGSLQLVIVREMATLWLLVMAAGLAGCYCGRRR